MKKAITKILLACVALTTIFSSTIFAKTGDIIGYAKYTDISAYINHYPITSYNINDYTAVIAEDLQNYGFNVVWNGNDRSLSITKNTEAKNITPYGTVYKYAPKAGQNSFPYLETDIVTYVNGNKVESFNIDGKTCIYMDSLAPYGEVVWVPEIRAIKMWIDGLPTTDYVALKNDPASFLPDNVNFYPGTSVPTYDSYTGAKFTTSSPMVNMTSYWYSGNYTQSELYRQMLVDLGWEQTGVDYENRERLDKDGFKRRVPYSQQYSFKNGEDYLFFTYYSHDGDVNIML